MAHDLHTNVCCHAVSEPDLSHDPHAVGNPPTGFCDYRHWPNPPGAGNREFMKQGKFVAAAIVLSLFAVPGLAATPKALAMGGACAKTQWGVSSGSLLCVRIGPSRWVWASLPGPPPVAPNPTAADSTVPSPPSPATAVPATAVPATAAPVTAAPATLPSATSATESVSQQNARKSADSYLRSSSFSRKGLIGQLEYERFSTADAEYAVDHVKVDWSEQAAKNAASYLKSSSFSRQSLYEQLLYEGFTPEQATYGVSTTGL